MRRLRRNLLLASVFAAAPLTMIAPAPASAQASVSIGFESFHRELAPYGDWLYSDRWGEVWRPMSQDRDRDWRPYWAGHWADTDEYGWTWISDESPWGEIAYHYGRWVYDPDDGWLWLPGYVWSPAWVVWRSSGPDVGWMPMPPDDRFLGRGGVSVGVSFGDWNDIGGYYGYSRWYGSDFDENRFGNLWVFVPGGRLTDPGYRRYALARPQTINIVRQSRNITNYTVVNNTIVNRSVNANVVQGAGGRAPQPVRANTVLHSTRFVAPVNQGEQIQQRARQERPHGNGQADSAPPPTPQVIQSLSTRAIPVRTQNNAPAANRNNGPNNAGPGNRGGGSHLFNRNTVQQFSARQQGQSNAAPAPNAQAQPGTPQQQQPNAPTGGNDNNRERRNRPENSTPDNNRPENRGPQPIPAAPNAAPPNPAERNREPERPQQQQATPQPPQQEERNNRPDGNQDRNFQREQQQQAPRATPERAIPPTPPERAATPTPPSPEDRGNRPDRNHEQNSGRDRTPPAMEQRAQPERQPERQMERQAAPERATPPSPPREAPQRPAMEQRPSPPPAPAAQAQPQRPPEAARPNPSPERGADRGPPPDRGQDRGQGRGDRPDNKGNDNR